MKTEHISGILAVILLILLLLLSFSLFWSDHLSAALFLILAVGVVALTISLLLTNKITKSSNTLIAKIYFSFVLNLSIFFIIMFFWLIGTNARQDEFGLVLLLFSIIFGSFAIIGFIIGLILSIIRKNKKEFAYNINLYSGIATVIVIILIVLVYLLFFHNIIITNHAVSSNDRDFCYLTFRFNSAPKEGCFLRIIIANKGGGDLTECNAFESADLRRKCYIWTAVAKKDLNICLNSITGNLYDKYNQCSTAVTYLKEEIYAILQNPQSKDIIMAIRTTPYLGIHYKDTQASRYLPLLKDLVKHGSPEVKKESLKVLMEWANSKPFEEEKAILREQVLPLIIHQPEFKPDVDYINKRLNAKLLKTVQSKA